MLVLVLASLVLSVTRAHAQERVLLGAPSGVGEAARSSPMVRATLQGLATTAQEKGAVRVIVGVRAAFAPEGMLSAATVALQRDEIASAQSAVLARLPAATQKDSPVRRFATIPYVALSVTAAELKALEQMPEVTSIEEDKLAAPSLAYSVPHIGGTTAWNSGYSGAGQAVAVLDTGVEKNHPLLAGKVVSEACYSSNYPQYGVTSACPGGVTESTVSGSGAPCTGIDSCSHGTHVAGIVAGKNGPSNAPAGVAKDANIIAMQVFSIFSSESDCGVGEAPCALTLSSDQIRALERVYALRSTYQIASVNMSLGGGQYFSQSACDADNASLKAAIDNLRTVGIATVISSGNDGYTDSMGAPGCISSAISVGSTFAKTGVANNCAGNNLGVSVLDAVSCFSNSVSFLNVLAPGSSISSSVVDGQYAIYSGTSMAAPHVAGAWAVLKQKKPTASVAEVLNAFVTTGQPVTDPRNGITKPRIQVAQALDALVGSSYTLSVSRQGVGSGSVSSSPAGINCGSTCSASYAAGTQVTLTAQAASGSSFAGWGGACTGTSSSCSVTMSAARSVTASFNVASNTRLVTLNKMGSGTGSVSSSPSGLACATDCSGASASFSSSAAITLTAQPSSGSVFAGWGGSCTGTGSCTIPAGSSDVNVTASFTLSGGAPRTVTLVKGGDGAGSVSSSPSGLTCSADCNQASATFAGSTTIVLTAQAATGSRFVGWTGACAGTGTCTIAAGSTNVRVTASFNTDSSGGGGPLPDPVQFVTQQYLDFLGRSPDSAGLSHWVSQLNAGSVTRAQLIESFMYSNEFQGRFGPLVRLYTAYFRRVPDYAGLMYWFNAMYPSSGGGGASLADVSQAFAQSAEFVNTYGALNNADFVTLVYQNVLGRTPDAEGFSYWLGQLNAGISRGAMMTGFSESTENQNATANSLLITMSYVGMLRREPDATGYAWWLGEVNAGRLRVLDLINGFLNSQEYARRF